MPEPSPTRGRSPSRHRLRPRRTGQGPGSGEQLCRKKPRVRSPESGRALLALFSVPRGLCSGTALWAERHRGRKLKQTRQPGLLQGRGGSLGRGDKSTQQGAIGRRLWDCSAVPHLTTAHRRTGHSWGADRTRTEQTLLEDAKRRGSVPAASPQSGHPLGSCKNLRADPSSRQLRRDEDEEEKPLRT